MAATILLRANLGSLLANAWLALPSAYHPEEEDGQSKNHTYQLIAYPFEEDIAEQCEKLLNEAFKKVPLAQRKQQIRSTGSYALLRDDSGTEVFGYARLQPSAKDPVGATWGMISSVIVSKKGCGLGKELMTLMEAEALSQGFRYSCVWIDDDSVLSFYNKCGYQECQPMNNPKSVLGSGKLDLSALSNLFQVRTAPTGQKCLRKRLAIRRPLQLLDIGKETELARVELIILMQKEDIQDWRLFVHGTCWEKQIGPCCGLAAIRMTAKFANSWEDVDDILLQTAINRKFSKDGELFDINHLSELCSSIADLNCEVRDFASLTKERDGLLFSLTNFCSTDSVVIIPYDKDSGSGYPQLKRGLRAHYGVIVGVAENASTREVVYFVRHSASSKLIGAKREDWIASNAQLVQRDTERYKDETDFINLACKCVVVTKSVKG